MTTLPGLVLLETESLTVSSSAVGITAARLLDSATNAQPLNIIQAVMSHVSGGSIYHTEVHGARGDITAISNPVAGGTAGELLQELGSVWVIKGRKSISVWKAIKATGESDATINIALYGPDEA